MGKITSLTGESFELDGCLGCEILNGKLTPFGGVLCQDEHFVVTQDFELPIDGFIIISSVRHIEKFTELKSQEREALVDLIDKVLNVLRSHKVAEEFNVILEEKKGYHFHVWLMPRHDWMIQKFGKVIKSIKEIQDYALEHLRTKENFEKIMQTCNILKEELKNTK